MRTLKDSLSHLSFIQACKLLGPRGKSLIMQGGRFDINLADQVSLEKNRFRLTLGNVRVDISLNSGSKNRMHLRCSACSGACAHQGAALSLILEEKLALGLSAPPPKRKPMESLSEEALVKQAVAERKQRAIEEKMRLKSMNPELLWTDYVVTNQASGKSYRLALRGWQPGESYCSCPDFRKNTLGTCKHIIYALKRGRAKFRKKVRNTPAPVETFSVYLQYGLVLELRLLLPENITTHV